MKVLESMDNSNRFCVYVCVFVCALSRCVYISTSILLVLSRRFHLQWMNKVLLKSHEFSMISEELSW